MKQLLLLVFVFLAVQSAEAKELRLISLAPTVTEMVFAVGAGDTLVAVTKYCDYPEAATKLPSVGGYMDPSYEAIVAARPSVVFVLREHRDIRAELEKLGLNVVLLGSESIAEILESIRTVGAVVGRQEAAAELVSSINQSIAEIQAASGARPRVLLSLGGHESEGGIERVYVAGPNTIYNELISVAGGENVYAAGGVLYPAVSVEGIVALAPEVVIDLVPDSPTRKHDRERLRGAWMKLRQVPAVRAEAVYVFTEEYMINPGPRLPLLLRQLSRAIRNQ